MSNNPNVPDRRDMAELTSIHGDFTDRVNDMAMVMQDQSYIVGRKRGLEEGRQQCSDLLAENQNMDRLMRASVPDRWKSCTSPVGAVQSYIAELEVSNAGLLAALKALVQQVERGDFEHIGADHPDSAIHAARAAINKTEQISA